MPIIPEIEPTPPFKGKPNIVELETKLCNASVHKKKRGLSRKLSQRQVLANKQQNQRGITRIKILRSDNGLTLQNDPGSNRNICNKPHLLLQYKKIPPIPIGGIKRGQPAIYATGRGLFPWRSDNGDVLLIEMLACSEADCTLLSPTAIVNQYPALYYGWNLYCNQDDESGTLQLLNRDGINHTNFNAFMENDLWYHYAPDATPNQQGRAVVHALSSRASFELWHHRLGHVCARTVENMHKYAL